MSEKFETTGFEDCPVYVVDDEAHFNTNIMEKGFKYEFRFGDVDMLAVWDGKKLTLYEVLEK